MGLEKVINEQILGECCADLSDAHHPKLISEQLMVLNGAIRKCSIVIFVSFFFGTRTRWPGKASLDVFSLENRMLHR